MILKKFLLAFAFKLQEIADNTIDVETSSDLNQLVDILNDKINELSKNTEEK